MESRRTYYEEHVDKTILISRAIFIIAGLVLFSIIMYDSFVNNLPFYYVIFFIIGFFISISYLKTQKITWDDKQQKFVKKKSIFGFILIVSLVILRLFVLPEVFAEYNIIFITDAILLLTVGIFAGRVHFTGRQIEYMTFNRQMKTIQMLESNLSEPYSVLKIK
jgi:hypothetical protein